MKNKAITRIQAAVFIVVLVAVGVGSYYGGTLTAPAPATTAPPAAVVTLTFVGPWEKGELDTFRPVLQEFTSRTGTNVDYVRQRTEDLTVTLPIAFGAQTTIGDVIVISTAPFVKQAATEGHVLDITDVIQPNKYPPVIETLKVGDRYYGAPLAGNVKPGFWYRKSFFQQNQLTPPTTLDEFKALLDRIKTIPGIEAPIASGDGVGWPLSDTTEAFIIGIGGPELQTRLINNEVQWTSPEVRRVFEELVDFLEAGYFSEPADFLVQAEKFWAGSYGLYFQGSFIVEFGPIQDPSDLDFFPFPGTRGAVGALDFAFVPAYTQRAQEAKQLLAFVTGPDGQAIHAGVAKSGRIATHKDVSLAALPPAKQGLVDFVTRVQFLPDLDDSLGGAYQRAFWDQLKLLWVRPGDLNSVLTALDEAQATHIAAT